MTAATDVDVATTLKQFEANADLVRQMLGDVSEERLRERRVEGKWSAFENLAHLGQFHDLIRERANLIATQDNPRFARYVPEQDPGTAVWFAKPAAQMLADFAGERSRLVAELRALPDSAWVRPGTHAAFGTHRLDWWLNFWLAHDGHHLMTAVVRART